MMRLSQTQLNLLEACPRRFQHTYIEQLGSPVTAEQQARLSWGTKFHRMMQQYALGLPVTMLEAIDPEVAQLQACVRSLISAAPSLFAADVYPHSEYRRTWEFEGYLFTAIYDLLLMGDEAQIFDWKTYPRPQRSNRLAQNWQTRLYPLVLTMTTDYSPDRIVMTYWFVQPDEAADEPQTLSFRYSAAQCERDRQQLIQLLDRLATWLQAYAQGEHFPQTPLHSACRGCSFQRRCQRESDDSADVQNLDDVAEVWL